jgi:hypothetical protein
MELVRPCPDVIDRRPTVLPTGRRAVDALLPGGGLPRGKLVEVAGARTSGKTSLALVASAAAAARGERVAWIDGPAELYLPAAAALGMDLDRLLVVRPGLASAARAAEIAARSRAFSLVVVDLPAGQRIEERTAARLRAAARDSAATIVVLAGRPGAVAQPSLALETWARRAGGGRAVVVSVRREGATRSVDVLFGPIDRYLPPEAARELASIDLELAPPRRNVG